MLHLLVSLALAPLVSCDFDHELHNKFKTMDRDEFVEYFNSRNYSYTIKAYDFESALGVMNRSIPEDIPVITYNESSLANLPDNFDSREKWPQCVTIGEILDQGKCGSCWVFGPATSASDRICIHKGQIVRLSEQDFNCLDDNVCGGGDPYEAFRYYITQGVVTQECKPYDIDILNKHECDKKCVNGANYDKDKHIGYSVVAIAGREDVIKAEIFNNGPVEAYIAVYEDFTAYHGGIYEHKYGKFVDGHSVRAIGYGIENGVPYWLAANSWGKDWGEKGFFRVKRFEKDLKFETMLTAMP